MQYLMDLYRTSSTEIIMLFVMLVSIIPLVFLIKKLIFVPVKNYLTRHHYEDYERVLKKYPIFRYLLHSLLGIYFISWGNIFHPSSFKAHILLGIKDTIVILYVSLSFTMLLLPLIDAGADLYHNRTKQPSAIS